MKIKDLTPNRLNPRKISDKKRKALLKSLEAFGDLSGFVFNKTSGQLISGHQRSSVLPGDAKITIEHKYSEPTKSKTVAEGYVEISGEKFKYREVAADSKWEAEAMLAANKHGGEWDEDVLRLLLHENKGLDIELTGFDEIELQAMEIELPQIMEIEHEPESGSESEPEVISGAIEHRDSESIPNTDGANQGAENNEGGGDRDEDAAYIRDNPGPDSEIRQENIDTINRNAFDQVKEKTSVLEREYVLIIKCNSNEHKAAIKDLIKEQTEKAGGKFF